jgi:hypothetical protein
VDEVARDGPVVIVIVFRFIFGLVIDKLKTGNCDIILGYVSLNVVALLLVVLGRLEVVRDIVILIVVIWVIVALVVPEGRISIIISLDGITGVNDVAVIGLLSGEGVLSVYTLEFDLVWVCGEFVVMH